MNGVPNSPVNRYNQVVGGVFSNNTFIDCDYFQLCAGSDAERSAVPVDTRIENNIFYHSTVKDIFTAFDDISGISFKNNYLNNGVKPITTNGIELTEMKLVTNEYGLEVESSTIRERRMQHKETGCHTKIRVSWYPRKSEGLKFDIGQQIEVELR
jgi:poly(beta-D-mannuronate) lyase